MQPAYAPQPLPRAAPDLQQSSDDESGEDISWPLPVDNIYTVAILSMSGLLPAVDKIQLQVRVLAILTSFLQCTLLFVIGLELGKSIKVPDECPSGRVMISQVLGLIVIFLYGWGTGIGDTLLCIDVISIPGLDNPTRTAIWNGTRWFSAIATVAVSLCIIRAADNPVDVIKDCLAVGLFLDIPGFVVTAMQKNMFGLTVMLASSDIGDPVQIKTPRKMFSTFGCMDVLFKISVVIMTIPFLASLFGCQEWCSFSGNWFFPSFLGPTCDSTASGD